MLIVKRYINVNDASGDFFAFLHQVADDLLNIYIKPKEPRKTGLMREKTYVSIRRGQKSYVISFIADTEYAEYTEFFSGVKVPSTPGTRLPWLQVGIAEGINELRDKVAKWLSRDVISRQPVSTFRRRTQMPPPGQVYREVTKQVGLSESEKDAGVQKMGVVEKAIKSIGNAIKGLFRR